MQKMNESTKEDPFSRNISSDISNGENNQQSNNGVASFIKNLIRPIKSDTSLRETLEEYIEEDLNNNHSDSVSTHERILISNILKIRDITAADIMVPRADIVSIADSSTQEDLFALLSEKQYSRLPVYKDTLDHVIGSIHVKDILATVAQGKRIDISSIVRNIPIVSPALPLLDLLLQMRLTRKHMVLVIDEYGGIDGLITIGDVIEVIVGETYDEHDPDDQPQIFEQTDGTIIADARYELEEFEERYGVTLNEEEREDNDTIGGLAVYMAGRVPVRGEVLTHESGIIFEILEADPRRVKKVRIRNIPKNSPIIASEI